jgi:hypothetical protein
LVQRDIGKPFDLWEPGVQMKTIIIFNFHANTMPDNRLSRQVRKRPGKN